MIIIVWPADSGFGDTRDEPRGLYSCNAYIEYYTIKQVSNVQHPLQWNPSNLVGCAHLLKQMTYFVDCGLCEEGKAVLLLVLVLLLIMTMMITAILLLIGVTIIIKVSLGITHTSQGRRTLQFISTRLGLSNVLFRVFDSEFISPMGHLYSLIGREPLFTPVLQKKTLWRRRQTLGR